MFNNNLSNAKLRIFNAFRSLYFYLFSLQNFSKSFVLGFVLLLVQLMSSSTLKAQLAAGDIAIVGYNCNLNGTGTLPNIFSFLILKPGGIPSGTTIYFTDNGWNPITSALGTTEGTITWSSTSALAQFTEVTLSTVSAGTAMSTISTGSASVSGTFLLSQAGDQVLAYTGTSSSPTFITGLHMNSDTPNGSSAGSSYSTWDNPVASGGNAFSVNRSAIPPGLTSGTNAMMGVINPGITGAEKDNGTFDCANSTGNSLADLKTKIFDPTKWNLRDVNYYTLPIDCSFFIAIPPSITTQPSSSTICNGSTTSFTIAATNASSYQWQVSTNGGGSFSNISATSPYSNVTTASLTITGATTALNGYQYRCVATGSESVNSNAATLTVNSAPSFSTHPSSSTICSGSNTSFTASATNASTYQWQVNDGAGFSNITNGGVYSGATTTTLTITGAGSALNGYLYRLVASGSCSPNATSNNAALTVNAAPSISINPLSTSITEGTNHTFTVTAANASIYQWQVNTGAGFSNISNTAPYSGATSANLTITNATTALTGYQYRVIISGSCTPNASSTAAVLTVNASVSLATVTTATQSAVGSKTATLGGNVTNSGGGSVTERGIVWGTSANPTTADTKVSNGSGVGSFSASISGFTAATTIHYRAYAINEAGTSYGNNVSFTTTTALNVNAGSLTSVACNGGSTGAASVSPIGGKTPYTYLWSNGATTSSILGIPAGLYTITVTDAEGTSAARNFTVTQPSVLNASAAVTNVSCNGGTNGRITLTVSGGAGGYSYAWSGGATSKDRTGLAAGSYSVTITDANACTKTISGIVVTQPAAISTTGSQTSSTATVTASGGTEPYTYSWAPSGGTDATASGLTAGTYTVTVTDANGCTATRSFTIASPLTAAFGSQTNVLCFGGGTGSATVAVTGGTAPYTYSWSPNGGTAATATGLAAGTYTVTVTDANSQTATRVFTISQPTAALTSSGAKTNVTCNGASNGSIVLATSGGTAPYTYSWTPNVSTGASAVGIPVGNYTVLITDANGCQISRGFTVTQPSAISLASGASSTNVSCNGGSNGRATVSPTGGAAPYYYSWSPRGGTAATATGLSAGIYTVTVTDQNGCQATRSYTITQPTAISASISSTPTTSIGSSTGSATVSASGGVPAYTYSWAPSGGTAATANNLAAGTYTVTITDANACQITKTVTVDQPAVSLATLTSATPSSVGSKTAILGGEVTDAGGGTISERGIVWGTSTNPTTLDNKVSNGTGPGMFTATISGLNTGTTLYARAYAINEAGTSYGSNVTFTTSGALSASYAQTNIACFGGNTGSLSVSATGGKTPYTYLWSNSATTATISNLTAGSYSVTIKDAENTELVRNLTITQPAAALSSTTVVTNIACFGGNTGSIILTPMGGTAPYTFDWGGGVTTKDRSNLVAGNYSVTITDANGCTSVRNVSITQPPAALSSTTVVTNIACFGGNTGSIILTPTGGTAPYTFDWGGGVTTKDRSNLVAGNYSVTITDANGCTSVRNVSITQPPAALSSTTVVTNIACFGGNTGSIILTPTGGTAPYTFDWGGGVTTKDRSNLVAGNYSVTITDANGCTSVRNVSITQPPAALSSTTVVTNIACFGGNTGSIILTPTGGTAPYTFDWGGGVTTKDRSNLVAGNYSVTITDANGCTSVRNVSITQPPAALSSTTVVTNIACFGGNTGSIILTPTGGTAPYTFDWGGGVTTKDRSNLVAGNYSVTITDANGCTSVRNVSITQPPAALSSTTVVTNIACFGGNTGSIILTPTGGTAPYTFDWGGGVTTKDRSNLVAGNYSVTITDANGCTSVRNVSIMQPTAPLSGTISVTNVGCFGGSNGAINLTPTGGTAPYTFVWSGGVTTEDRTGLVAGTYSVTITDANGCTALVNGIVTQPSAVALAGATLPAGTVSVSYSQTLAASGSSGSYTYTLASGTLPSGITLSTGGQLSGTPTVAGSFNFAITATDQTCTSVSATSNFSITLTKGSQTITFNNIGTKTYGDLDFTLGNSQSSAGLPITYTAADPSVVSITGNTAHILKAGTTQITASQSGNTNYESASSVNQTLSISKKDITLSLKAIPAITKVYDAGTTANLAAGNYSLTGIEGSDAVTVSGTANYDTKLIGTGKTITAASFVLAGADKDNYTLTTSTATTTGSITKKDLTLTLNTTPAISKVYDAGTTATLASGNYTLTGIQGSDAVTVSGTASYDSKLSGTGKTVTANSFVLAGADKDNYNLTTTTATTTGSITKKDLTLALNASPVITKVYDAGTTASLAAGNYTLTGIEGSDAVTVSGTANYDTKLIGTGKTITVNTFVLAGADKDNYNLTTTTATTTGAITGKPLTLTLNALPAITKVYDATTTATLAAGNYTLTGIQGSDAVTVSGTASYDTKLIGTGKTVTANNFVLAGADKDNYTLTTTTATTTGSITKKDLTLALNASPAITKVYDAGTTANLAAGNYSLTGIEGSDAVTVSGTANYDSKLIGTDKTITVNTFVLAGADKDNYNITTTTATTTGAITGKPLTLTLNALPGITKVYDATTTATLAAGNYTLTGIQGSDAVTVSGTASYDTKTIGIGKTVTAASFVLVGADKDNYTLTTTTATTTGSISKKDLTLALNASPAITKVYDAGTTATLATANYTLTGVEGSDAVTVSGTASYDNKTIGTGKTVTAASFVLAGADKDNYTLTTTTATTTGSIIKKDLTLALNASPAITKVYDATTTATLAAGNYTLTGIQGSDAVTVSGTASYDSKLIGTGKTVTANNFVLAGADKDNYTLTTTTAMTTGSITKKDLTLALNATPAITKVYDAGTTANLAAGNYTLTGIQGSDAVTVSGTANYDSKLIGTDKTITVNTFVLAGADKDNYNITTTTATTTGAITGKPLTLTLNALPGITKVYDATTTATLAAGNYTLTGIQGSDAVTVSGTASYDNKTIGTGKTVTANNFVLAGADKDNYTLTTTTATTTGTITKKGLTLALNASPAITKVYDAGTTATLAAGNYTLTGIQGSDAVTVSGTANYDSKLIGTGKTIAAGTFVLGGADKDNYNLTTTTATTTGDITSKALTLTLNSLPAITKVYDAGTTASLSADNYTLTGIQGSDAVTVSGTASYDTKLIGTGKTVTGGSFVLAGADKDNYTLTTTTATTTGSITKKDLTLALNATPAITKVYDAETTANLAAGNYTLTGIQGTDAVTVSGTASYDSKTIGTGKTVTAASFVLAGADKDNYTLTTTTATTTGTITKKDLTLALNATPAITKVYDAGTSATLAAGNYTLTGIQGSDAVTVSGTANYDSKLIGTGKTITAGTFVLGGADKDNYNLTTTTATTTGDITSKALTLTLNSLPAITKVYDAGTTASLSAANYTLIGIQGSDAVTVSGTANYDSKLIGTGKTVTANSFVLAGADKGNYTLTTTTATTTGSIIKKDLTLVLNASPAITKVYDATTTASLAAGNYTFTGIEGSDAVTVSGTASYDTKTIGTGKTVTVNTFVLAGADKDNYNLTTTTATTTGSITKKDLSLTLNASPAITKVYDAGTTATLAAANYTLTGIEGSDAVTVSGTASYDTKLIGTGKTITAGSFALAGADKDNYNLTTTTATTTGAITGKPLTLTLNALPAITKVYDATTTATLAAGNYTLTGIQGSDAVTVSGTASYDTKTIGTGKTVTAASFVLAGADKDNYTLTTTTATTTGSITKKDLTLTLNATPTIAKVYDAGTTATLAAGNYTLTGIQGSDAVTVSGTANYDTKLIGTGKTIMVNTFVLAGADKDNYNLTTTTATTTGAITGKPLTLTLNALPAITKVYDAGTMATLASGNYTLTGIEGSDAVTVSGTASYDNKTIGSGKTVTANSFVLAGADKDNYTLTTTTATTTGSITKKDLTLALNASPAITKVYDANTTASLSAGNYTLTGIQGSDAVTVSGTASYDSKLIGTGKTVTAGTFVLAGADKDNYNLTTATATTTGAITSRTLTLALNASPAITKVYDATTTATLAAGNYSLTGVQGSDAVTVSGTAGYDSKLIGTGKTITAGSFALAGADKDNYNLTTTTATTTGAITSKPLTLTLNALPVITKVYDATTSASLVAANYSLSGIQGTDVVTVSGSSNYANADAGNSKTVTASNFVLAGGDKDNYTLTTTTASTSGVITPKPIEVIADAKSKAYGAADPVFTYTFKPDLLGNDRFIGELRRAAGEAVGSYAINLGILAVTPNYQLMFMPANLTIGKRDVTVTIAAASKVYGSADPSFSYTVSPALSAGDSFSGSPARLTGENVGSYAIGQGSLSLNNNYNVQYLAGTMTINPKSIVITGDSKSKTYGDADPVFTYSVSPALIGSDQLTGSLSRNPGEGVGNYTMNLGSLANANYSLSLSAGSLSINKRQLLITADDKTRSVGMDNPVLTASYTGFANGENSSVLSQQPLLSTTATSASAKGDYPITVSGASANNYQINYQNGTLRIQEGSISDILMTSTPLYENATIGTGFGQLRALSDNPLSIFTYSLVSGTGSTDNGLFRISGNFVQVATTLDYETKSAYSIRVRAVDQNGLTFEKVFAITLIDVNEAPTLAAIADRSICSTTSDQTIALTGISAGPESGQTVTLSVSSTNPSLFASLSVVRGSGNTGTLSYRLAAGAQGTATISVTANDNGGVNFGGVESVTQRFVLTVNALPLANISSDKGVNIFRGETVVLTATGGSSYSWATADGIVSGQNTAALTVKPTATTTYTVTVTNASGCTEQKSITLNVSELPVEQGAAAKATNVMSPNGDGVNDNWVVEDIQLYPNNSVRIIDRAGRAVYEKRGYDNTWDATLRGAPLAEGTYYYIIDFGDGKTIKKGFITILRKR